MLNFSLVEASGFSVNILCFRLQVLELQNQVTNIKAFSKELGREVRLSDICFKPLEPASHECGVFSPLEYFQSNGTRLDAVVR